jgi:hypothetical protein
MFAGEENYGRFLDLNEQFHLFMNLEKNNDTTKNHEKIDYIKYLDIVGDFDGFSSNVKLSIGYFKYTPSFVSIVMILWLH